MLKGDLFRTYKLETMSDGFLSHLKIVHRKLLVSLVFSDYHDFYV